MSASPLRSSEIGQMPSLGEQLRAQRERKGITLEQAAADTRIREKSLTALEAGDYPALPGAVYTRGFLRNYAEYLDLETDELVALFQQERGGAPPEPTPKRSFKPYRPVVHQSLIFRPVVFVPVLIIAFVGLFLGYMYYQLDRKSTRLNSSHSQISYAVFCLKKKKSNETHMCSILT